MRDFLTVICVIILIAILFWWNAWVAMTLYYWFIEPNVMGLDYKPDIYSFMGLILTVRLIFSRNYVTKISNGEEFIQTMMGYAYSPFLFLILGAIIHKWIT